MHHYRCYRVWANETTAERIVDTLAWFPTKVAMPTSSSTDAAIAAARDLIHALRNPSPASPLAPLTDSHHAQLRQLAEIFADSTQPPTTPATPVPPGFDPLPPTAQPRVTWHPSLSDAALPRVPSPALPAPLQYPDLPRVSPILPTEPLTAAPLATSRSLTYIQATGNAGKRRRAAKKAAKARPPSQTSTVPHSSTKIHNFRGCQLPPHHRHHHTPIPTLPSH